MVFARHALDLSFDPRGNRILELFFMKSSSSDHVSGYRTQPSLSYSFPKRTRSRRRSAQENAEQRPR
ncbi:Protein of unknown function [Gryllus bimaculatus]|nr:Protein of unknown function [Gryllus bimaculatus]